jgi:protein-tyrosine phosphatase
MYGSALNMSEDGRIGILFICTGNICRSPSAHGVFDKLIVERRLSHRFDVDSAGIEDYHIGAAPDSRSIKAAQARSIVLAHLRARQLAPSDYRRYDYLIAMDKGHLRHLQRQMPVDMPAPPHIALLMDFVPGQEGTDVPDPYYGGPQDFERMLDLVEAGCKGLLQQCIEAD